MTFNTQALWRRGKDLARKSFRFDRPLLLLQSDDWGRVGVRDREGLEQLRAAGVELGEKPYDFYTLETCEDIENLREVLSRHHDTTGRSPSVVMNFIVGNLDFEKMAAADFREVILRPLSSGLPGHWSRPGLFDAYRRGIDDGVFYPALHGISHFCREAVQRALSGPSERLELLHALWRAETPYIYWRMPWVGYEYWDPDRAPEERFLPRETQNVHVKAAADAFSQMFGKRAESACAPGYRADRNTHSAWVRAGIKTCQNGPGRLTGPYFDESGILNLHRSVNFEPATDGEDFSLEGCVRSVAECFERGIPAIVSVHSINFHSSLRDFRSASLQLLDRFLISLESKYPDLLYVNDGDLYSLVQHGSYRSGERDVPVRVTQVGLLAKMAGGKV